MARAPRLTPAASPPDPPRAARPSAGPPAAAASPPPRVRRPRDPHARASLELAERCPELAPMLAAVGPCKLERSGTEPFAELARAIVFQQLAGRAAATIHGRVTAALDGRWDPSVLLAAEPDALRAAGLSRNKLLALLDLAAHVADGRLDLHALDAHGDDEVVAALVDVRGIGRWTAEMFLLFHQRRLDVWPVGDLGVRKGWAVINQAALPTPAALQEAGERYRPYRSVAAWWCWRAADTTVASPVAPSAG